MSDDRRFLRRETLRSLWFLPTVFIVAALAAGYGLSSIEVDDGGLLDSLIFGGDAAAARELLIVVSGTMITVTGLVFVLTVVALQIASTQFSPRLLRAFLQDFGTRLVLSVFVATFAYSLGGLFTVGQTTETGIRFEPRLAVTGSLVLALVSVGMLVYYIQHITNSIRIDTVMLGVRTTTLRAIDAQYPLEENDSEAVPTQPRPGDGGLFVPVQWSGYVQAVDTAGLVAVSSDFDVSIELMRQVGHHVVAGTPLARVDRAVDRAVDREIHTEELARRVNAAVTTSFERRVERDVGYGIRQLVDIALRAVAPSVNDPYTAVQAIQHLSIIMAELARRPTDQFVHVQEDRRVFVPVPGFEVFLDVICSNIRRSACDRPRVMAELFRLLESTALLTDSASRRAEVGRHVDLALQAIEDEITSGADLVWVRSYAAAASDVARSDARKVRA